MIKRYNPVLKNRLSVLAKKSDAQGMLSMLRSLSVSDFRTAGYLLAEEVLPMLSGEDYWTFFSVIVPSDAKAFLGTFLKAAPKLYREGRLTVDAERLSLFAETCSDIDKSKVVTAFLPLLRTPEEVALVITLFCNNQLDASCPYLIKAHTLPCFYRLFVMLKMAEPDEVRRVAIMILKKADAMSYRMASILKAYFGIQNLPAQLSFKLEDYQLNLLDQGYERFAKMMTH